MKQEYAEQVAAKLIEQLKQGTAPWQRPWKPGELVLPYNANTGKPYRGINIFWLEAQGYKDPRWITYKQATELGGQVRKGSKGTQIVYWKFTDTQLAKDENGKPIMDEDGKQKTITVKLERPRSFTAVVFNAEQIDGLAPLEPRPIQTEPERHQRAETIIANSLAKIEHVPGNRAFYRPSSDSITLPERSQFETQDAYYSTALHEIGHWTGHETRLNRDLSNPFGSMGYAREELRAEISSLMLAERMEIEHNPEQHAAYVGSWIKVLQDDPREIFRAASDAEKISSYIMAFEHEIEKTKLNSKVLHEPEQEHIMNERIYLAVPYTEKDEAKKLGAKWDKEAKSWYAPEGVDLKATGLEKWNPETTAIVKYSVTEQSIETQLASALKAAGLNIPGEPIMDGKLHRVPVEGDKGSEKSGAYAAHLEGVIPGAYIQNYKTGEVVNWKAEGKINALSDEEKARLNAEAAQRQQQRQKEIDIKHKEAMTAANVLWNESPVATTDNQYCKAKGIDPIGLKTVPEHVSPEAAKLGIKIAKTAAEAKEFRDRDKNAKVFKSGDLLIPGKDKDGQIWTVQSVNPYFKSFMKGGKKHGLFTVVGAENITSIDNQKPLIIAEGYATAASVSKALDQPVIVAFDSGNIDAVARELRTQYPTRLMIIAADNDHNAPKQLDVNGKPKPNVGLEMATNAAKKHGAGVMAPQFKEGEKGSDWNDFATEKGSEEMRKHISEQMAAAIIEATLTAERITTLARTRDMEARNDPTTSADDVMIAEEKSKAAATIAMTASQLSEVRSKTSDAMLGNKKSTLSPSAVKASIDSSKNVMTEKAKEEHQSVLNKPIDEKNTKTKKRNSKGVEVDF